MLRWRGRGVLTGRGWLHVKMEGGASREQLGV